MGEKSVTNLLESIEKSKQAGFARILFGLGIRHVGQYVAEILARTFGSIDTLLQATEAQLAEINGVGPTIAHSLSITIQDTAFLTRIARLKSAGVVLELITQGSQILAGKTFVITGTLPNLSRSAAEQLIKNNGGSISNAVGKKTDYLLLGTGPGSKFEKAKTLGVRILNEAEFLVLVKS